MSGNIINLPLRVQSSSSSGLLVTWTPVIISIGTISNNSAQVQGTWCIYQELSGIRWLKQTNKESFMPITDLHQAKAITSFQTVKTMVWNGYHEKQESPSGVSTPTPESAMIMTLMRHPFLGTGEVHWKSHVPWKYPSHSRPDKYNCWPN